VARHQERRGPPATAAGGAPELGVGQVVAAELGDGQEGHHDGARRRRPRHQRRRRVQERRRRPRHLLAPATS